MYFVLLLYVSKKKLVKIVMYGYANLHWKNMNLVSYHILEKLYSKRISLNNPTHNTALFLPLLSLLWQIFCPML